MPIYEYECKTCSRRFEHIRSMEERHSVSCPDCGGSARICISLSNFYMEQPATIRYADGRIFAQRPRGGELPPPMPPTPEQRDEELGKREKEKIC